MKPKFDLAREAGSLSIRMERVQNGYLIHAGELGGFGPPFFCSEKREIENVLMVLIEEFTQKHDRKAKT